MKMEVGDCGVGTGGVGAEVEIEGEEKGDGNVRRVLQLHPRTWFISLICPRHFGFGESVRA